MIPRVCRRKDYVCPGSWRLHDHRGNHAAFAKSALSKVPIEPERDGPDKDSLPLTSLFVIAMVMILGLHLVMLNAITTGTGPSPVSLILLEWADGIAFGLLVASGLLRFLVRADRAKNQVIAARLTRASVSPGPSVVFPLGFWYSLLKLVRAGPYVEAKEPHDAPCARSRAISPGETG